MQQADDYIKEVEALADLLSGQPDDVFQLKTLFKSWTVNDVIGHLHMFDLAALAALASCHGFAPSSSFVGRPAAVAQVQSGSALSMNLFDRAARRGSTVGICGFSLCVEKLQHADGEEVV